MTNNSRFKIGVLGLGSIGARHARNFRDLGCQVVGYDSAFSDFDDFIKVMNSDAIVIASPTDKHHRHLVGGTLFKKPMLVEKPVVLTRSQLSNTPEKYIKLVGYNLRFHSCVKKAKEWLARGKIGTVFWANFTCAQYNDKPAYRRDGVVLNWSHEIDLALYLLDPTTSHKAYALQASIRNNLMADIMLKHNARNICSTIHLDYVTRPEYRRFVIAGEEGTIEVDLVSRSAVLRDKDDVTQAFLGSDNFDANYVEEAQYFLDLLDDKVKPEDRIGCTAIEGLAVNRICLEAMEYAEFN